MEEFNQKSPPVSPPEVSTHPSPTEPPNSDIATGTGFGVAGIIVFIIVIIIVIIVKRRYKKDMEEEEEEESGGESEDESDSEEDPQSVQMRLLRHQASESDIKRVISDVHLLGVVKAVLIDVSRLTIRRQLGKGQFGAVYEAKLIQDDDPNYGGAQPERVAVKTLRGAGMDRDEVEGFLREGIIMKDFHHPHVLGLVGVAFGDHSIPMIILPYMENGSLREYIGDPDLSLTIRKLLQFAREVALGMDYLACQKFVHRDLATRNCMLDEKKVVKVADFGLSRDIYTREYYASADHQARLPVKWMAIESLTRAVYTTKSDVWSFGVLIWELMTRGVTPYPDVTNWDIRAYVCSGRRMPKPQLCPDDVYDIMVRCWQEDPRDRPDFCDLAAELEELLSSEVEISPDSDYYVNVEPLTP